jgi:hypothetical protein
MTISHLIWGQLRQYSLVAAIVGFDAPETRRAACPAERELGDMATRRVRELVQSAALDFEFVPRSCPPGTEGKNRDAMRSAPIRARDRGSRAASSAALSTGVRRSATLYG